MRMTRDEAIDNLSVAFGRCKAEAIEQMAYNMDKLNEAFRKAKTLAKSLPRQDRKSYVSPYAKFDKIRRKNK